MAVSGLGTIKAVLEKISYSSGEQVNGFIHLNLEEDYPGNLVYISIKGVEETSFEKQEGKHRRTYKQTNMILDHEFPVYRFNTAGGIPRGMYSFPISFMLPNYIPSSMYSIHGLDFAKISYVMKASLPTPDKNLVPSVMSETTFLVTNPDIQTPSKSAIRQKSVSCCCCFPRGQTKISVQFEKASYNFGEEAGIIVDIDNSRSRADAKKIKASLVQYLFLTARSRKKIISQGVRAIELPGAKAGEVKMGIRLPLKITPTVFRSKKTVNATAIGGLVKNCFFLEVAPDMGTCTCGSGPRASIYVNISNRPKDFAPSPNQPQGQNNPFADNFEWKPQVMQGYVGEFKPEFAKSDLSGFQNNRFGSQGNKNYSMAKPNGPGSIGEDYTPLNQ